MKHIICHLNLTDNAQYFEYLARDGHCPYSMYKRSDDVGTSRNLIVISGLKTMSTSQKVDFMWSQTMTGINSHFAVMAEEEILPIS